MIHAERGNRQLVGVSLEGRRFEQFIQELSASFVRSPVDEIAGEIDHWIREIVLGLNLDRGALAQIDAKSGKLTVRHSWGATVSSSFRSASSLPDPPLGLMERS